MGVVVDDYDTKDFCQQRERRTMKIEVGLRRGIRQACGKKDDASWFSDKIVS